MVADLRSSDVIHERPSGRFVPDGAFDEPSRTSYLASFPNPPEVHDVPWPSPCRLLDPDVPLTAGCVASERPTARLRHGVRRRAGPAARHRDPGRQLVVPFPARAAHGRAFSACPADSIDYAVMEKTDKAAVIPLDAGWNDVGSWSALWDVTDKDASGNAISGDVLTVDSKNSYIYSEDKLVTIIGVEDLVVVETKDAVMIAPKARVQEVKQIVDQLKQQGRSEAQVHKKAYRPWGHYDSVDSGDRHQTKRIVVKPGAKLSLQKHHHRAEHWVVVKGTALVTRGDEQILLTENESTFIPLGTVHRLENPGVIPLEIVEVQSGSYLGEDDIVRFGDNYGRS